MSEPSGAPRPSLCRSPAALAGVATGLALLLAASGCTGSEGPRSAADLTNPRLSPAYAQWLVGAVGAMATPEEVREYLALDSDFAAIDFIEGFWARRDPEPGEPGNPLRELFERRSAEADRRFGEGGVSGHKTPRGVVYVLCGPPERTDYEIPRRGGPAVEVWFYDDGAARCLDGSRPAEAFRFQKLGEVTTIYRPGGPPVRPDLER